MTTIEEEIYIEEDRDEDPIERKVLFNDTFGVRCDYMKGLFYEVRRKYLKEPGGDNIKPPDGFIISHKPQPIVPTPKPVYKSIEQNVNSDTSMRSSMKSPDKMYMQLTGPDTRQDRDSINTKSFLRRQEVASKKIRYPVKRFVIQKYSSTDSEDWVEDFMAGCRIWVNNKTGEVSSICPWTDTEGITSSDEQSQYPTPNQEIEEEYGTGSLVYDNKDVNALLNYLDSQAQKHSVSSIKNRVR